MLLQPFLYIFSSDASGMAFLHGAAARRECKQHGEDRKLYYGRGDDFAGGGPPRCRFGSAPGADEGIFARSGDKSARRRRLGGEAEVGCQGGRDAALWDFSDACARQAGRWNSRSSELEALRRQLDAASIALTSDSPVPIAHNGGIDIEECLLALGRDFGADVSAIQAAMGSAATPSAKNSAVKALATSSGITSPWSSMPSSPATLRPGAFSERTAVSRAQGSISLTPAFHRCLLQLAGVLEAARSLLDAEAGAVARIEATLAPAEALCRRARSLLANDRAIALAAARAPSAAAAAAATSPQELSPAKVSESTLAAERRLLAEIAAARTENAALWACCVGDATGSRTAAGLGLAGTPASTPGGGYVGEGVGGRGLLSADAEFAEACQAALGALRGRGPALGALASAPGLPSERRTEVAAATDMLWQLLQLLELGAASAGAKI